MKVDGGKEALDLERPFTGAVHAEKALSRTLGIYWRFFVAGLTRHLQTGGIVPSQRILINQMISAVPTDYRGQVLELGAGTGVLTLRLAARCPGASIVACEINPVLAGDLGTRLTAAGLRRRVQIVCKPAEQLLERMRQEQQALPDFILSGIPLGNLKKDAALALIESIHRTLPKGGLYIQFQHSLMDRRKIKNTFSSLRTVPVALNFPPAFVYYAEK